jgi:hypothetical protein
MTPGAKTDGAGAGLPLHRRRSVLDQKDGSLREPSFYIRHQARLNEMSLVSMKP